ncbi:MAG: hypothetical protein ABI083_14630, partial [Lapillicoccus sp.]
MAAGPTVVGARARRSLPPTAGQHDQPDHGPAPAVEVHRSPVSGLGPSIQHALEVGAVDDPLELEAERVAATVVAALRRRAASAGADTAPS